MGTLSYCAFTNDSLRNMRNGLMRSMAVTFDDLPCQPVDGCVFSPEEIRDINRRLLAALTERSIRSIAFVNEGFFRGAPRDGLASDVLGAWLEAGQDLGNHTFSHCDINEVSLEEFQRDIEAGAPTLCRLLQARRRRLRYFRHPCLHTGPDRETRDALDLFLERSGYLTAPVTIDNQEWLFALAYDVARRRGDLETRRRVAEAYVPFMMSVVEFFEAWSIEVLGYEPPQVLLLHVNELNAECFSVLADALVGRGYRFVSLETALEDPAYRLEDGYAGRDGLSWIHRWALGMRMTLRQEPREPAWIADLSWAVRP